jgi:hypothetical protein
MKAKIGVVSEKRLDINEKMDYNTQSLTLSIQLFAEGGLRP